MPLTFLSSARGTDFSKTTDLKNYVQLNILLSSFKFGV